MSIEHYFVVFLELVEKLKISVAQVSALGISFPFKYSFTPQNSRPFAGKSEAKRS